MKSGKTSRTRLRARKFVNKSSGANCNTASPPSRYRAGCRAWRFLAGSAARKNESVRFVSNPQSRLAGFGEDGKRRFAGRNLWRGVNNEAVKTVRLPAVGDRPARRTRAADRTELSLADYSRDGRSLYFLFLKRWGASAFLLRRLASSRKIPTT